MRFAFVLSFGLVAACGGSPSTFEVVYIGTDAGHLGELAQDAGTSAVAVAPPTPDAGVDPTLDAGQPDVQAEPADGSFRDAAEDGGSVDAETKDAPVCVPRTCFPGECGYGLDGCGGAVSCGGCDDAEACQQCPGTAVSMCGGACN